MIARPDEDHLRYAAREKRALYSFNVVDFCRLHNHTLGQGQEHAGIVLAQQQRYSVGEQLRRLLTLIGNRSVEEMHNRVEFLSSWKPA